MCEYCEGEKPFIGDEQNGACIENGNILAAYGECHTSAKGRINFLPDVRSQTKGGKVKIDK